MFKQVVSAGQASLDESIASITSADCLLCGCLSPLQTLWVVDSQWGGQVGGSFLELPGTEYPVKGIQGVKTGL